MKIAYRLMMVVFLIPLIAITLVISFLFAIRQSAMASIPEAKGTPPSNPDVGNAILELHVNYAHDWVEGQADVGASVYITVTDNLGTYKDGSLLTADNSGFFFVNCEDWYSGQCPDIQPGDRVFSASDSVEAEISPIGSITGKPNAETNIVDGNLEASWLTNPAHVSCQVWGVATVTPIYKSVNPAEGEFTCDFLNEASWDLKRGDEVALIYFEDDGDQVINIIEWPWMRVNYSNDWVGGNYEMGHTFWITVTDSIDTVKATAEIVSQLSGGWEGDGFETMDWQWIGGQPDIQPFDLVYLTSDDGYTNTLEVGLISGTLDVNSNQLSGQVFASGFESSLIVECHPWGAWIRGINDAPTKDSSAKPDGSIPFNCAWDPSGEWDILPGDDVAAMYIEPDGDRIIDVYREPASHLHINKWSDSDAAESGNQRYTIEFWNDGDAPATNVVITDSMSGGLLYLDDTSGYPHTGGQIGPIVWDIGTINPDERVIFDLFTEVSASEGEVITNSVWIATSDPYDQGEAWEKSSTWVSSVISNDTHLSLDKEAWTGDPTPGHDLVFSLNVCNQGSTASNHVIMTDTLHQKTSLIDWWAEHPGWKEETSSTHELVISNPSIPGGKCSEIYLRANLASTAIPGDSISNTAVIYSSNDLEVSDNHAFWRGNANQPRSNLFIHKRLNSGSLVAGGEINYSIGYLNDGNVPVEGPILITDTFPSGTTFVSAWHYDPGGGHHFPPLIVTNEYAVWELATLGNGFGGEFEITLAIDQGLNPGAILVNEVEISYLPDEQTHTDNTSKVIEYLKNPGSNLRINKSHEWKVDGQLGYRIHFMNIGNQQINNVWITDTLPADTNSNGWWYMDFDTERLTDWEYIEGSRTFTWELSELFPGEAGWLYINTDLVEPGLPLRWYTNTIEISIPLDDTEVGDNYYQDSAFSGGEVRRVNLWLNPNWSSSIWGEAVPGATITVTTPYTEVTSWADPECDGCWEISNVGQLNPGDIVEVEAGDALMPVTINIPDPFSVEANSFDGEVSGQIGGWASRPVGIHGFWPNGLREVTSDANGYYTASYTALPRGASGFVRILEYINYAEVFFHHPFMAPDLIMDINYGHDWIEGLYEPGHTIWITATESDGSTVKGIAELDSGHVPGWEGRTGFSTIWQGWLGNQPDLQAGDWIIGKVDNGYTSTVRIGEVTIFVDYESDIVSGTLNVTGVTEDLLTRCEIWDTQSTPWIENMVDPSGGQFECDFASLPWDIQPNQTIAVLYQDPDGHKIINLTPRSEWWIYLPVLTR